jgi:glycosyltransferase involved in cell wall biosynthesis
MVTTFYPPYHFGGDAIFVRALARALTAEGHEVEVVHCEDAYRLGEEKAPVVPTESDGVVVHRLRSPMGLLSPLITQQTGRPGLKRRRLRNILSRDFDVVNFHNISLVGGPGVLGMSKAPVILYTLHEHWLLCPMHTFWKNKQQACDRPQCIGCCVRSGIPPQLWRYTDLIERSLANVDMLLSPSEYTAGRHRAAGYTLPIQVLPTFSSLDPGPIVNGAFAERPCFLYMGRVTASKGVAALLHEFSTLKDYELLIVGDGDLRPDLQREYARYPHIRFLGALPQSQLVPLYQKVTALVLPSLAPEVFPLSVLEAFACGTPAIVHNAGGSREAIDKTGAGFVYDSREGLHQALSTLAKDPHLRATLGQRARAGYEQFYSQERYLAGYLDVVEEIGKKKDVTLH